MQQHNGDHIQYTYSTNILSKWKIRLYDGIRVLVVDTGEGINKTAGFTPTEYRLLKVLVCKKVVSSALLMRVSGISSPRLLIRHIDNIRSKLRPLNMDVPCVTKYGFILILLEDVEELLCEEMSQIGS